MQPDTSSLGYQVEGTDTFLQNEVVTPKVLIEKNPGEAHNYPVTRTIDRNLSPDWVLIIALVFLGLFAWINVIYSRFIGTILQSAVNYQASQRLYGDPNQVQKRISRLFDIIYFITGGLYFYLLYKYFQPGWLDFPDLKLFMIFTGALFTLALLRLSLFKITGLVCDQLKVFNEALFQYFLYNKITGVLIVPFLILISYTRGLSLDIIIYLSIIIFICINILRFTRGVIYSVKKVFYIFYFILYLCTLEILPVLVIIKVILLLAKVS